MNHTQLELDWTTYRYLMCCNPLSATVRNKNKSEKEVELNAQVVSPRRELSALTSICNSPLDINSASNLNGRNLLIDSVK